MERVRAADCDVISLMVAWELRKEGYPFIWRHIIGSDITDMALAFSQGLDHKFYGRKELHIAMLAAFRQWFENLVRVKNCDRDALDYMDDVLAESWGFKVEASVKSGVTGFVCNDCGFKVKRGNNEGTEVQLHYRTHHEK